jgi:hypothetical protein
MQNIFHRVKKRIKQLVLPDSLSCQNYVISFPKSGRTWLRFMLGNYFVLRYKLGIEHPDAIMELDFLNKKRHGSGKIKFTHEDSPFLKRPEELDNDKRRFKKARVIFLVRDPRDVVVSSYFEHAKRIHLYKEVDSFDGSIQEFLYQTPVLKTIVTYYNIWYKNRSVPADFLILRYEDLKKDAEGKLKEALTFFGQKELEWDLVKESVLRSRFEKMRAIEKRNHEGYRLNPGNVNDPESFKTRKGIVGGYKMYFNEEDQEFMNKFIREHLADEFGYSA